MSTTMRTVLRSNEFTCPSCVSKIERELKGTVGVKSAKVHFTTGRIEVEHDDEASTNDLVAAVKRAGYNASAGW